MLDGGEIKASSPAARGIFAPPIELVALEGLEADGFVEEIFDLIIVEVIGVDADGLASAPIVGIALIGDGAASVETGQFVGARAHGRFEAGLGNVAALAAGVGVLPPVLGAVPAIAPGSGAVRDCRPD